VVVNADRSGAASRSSRIGGTDTISKTPELHSHQLRGFVALAFTLRADVGIAAVSVIGRRPGCMSAPGRRTHRDGSRAARSVELGDANGCVISGECRCDER
jgi:hypothetical protein